MKMVRGGEELQYDLNLYRSSLMFNITCSLISLNVACAFHKRHKADPVAWLQLKTTNQRPGKKSTCLLCHINPHSSPFWWASEFSCTETCKVIPWVKNEWQIAELRIQPFCTKQAFQLQVIYTFKCFGIYAVMMSVNSKRAAASQTADFGLRAAIFTASVDTLPVFVIQVGDIRARSSCWRGFCCEAACWLRRSVKCASEDIA